MFEMSQDPDKQSLPEENQRVKILIDHLAKGNVANFVARLSGVSHQTVNRIFHVDKRTRNYPGVSSSIMTAITSAFPSVNPQWLISGKGQPFFDADQTEIIPGQGSSNIDLLARALADQAKAYKIQASANDKYAEGFQALTRIVELIHKEMARADTQAKIDNKIDDVLSSLADAKEVEEIAAKHRDSKFQEIADLILQSGSQKINPSQDAGNKLGGIGGDDKTPHRSPRKRK